jgi:hypothetical protein
LGERLVQRVRQLLGLIAAVSAGHRLAGVAELFVLKDDFAMNS